MGIFDFFRKKSVNSRGEEIKVTYFRYPVDRQSVETCSDKEIISIKDYVKNITTVSIAKQRLNRFKLTINGYGGDTRELYEIPEVCVWARDCFQKIPYLIYFLDHASTYPFVSWLLGPISKTEAFSKEFESTFSDKLTEVMISCSYAASEYIITLGGNDNLFLLFSSQRTAS
ncbi:MAG: hypothetical protein ABSE05_09085 [Syntrophales bacterium]